MWGEMGGERGRDGMKRQRDRNANRKKETRWGREALAGEGSN